MIIAVTDFNKKRNNLDFDMRLELNMLKEEIREFWDATTVAERLDALVDTEYVWLGTKIKASYNVEDIPEELSRNIGLAFNLMREYLYEELGELFNECYSNAKTIVCNANAIKGSKLDNYGKVIKDDEHNRKIDPTKQIALMIEDVTKPRSY